MGGVKTTLRRPLGCRTAGRYRGSLPRRHKPVSRLRLHLFVSEPPPCSQVFGLFIIQHFHTVFSAMSTTYLQHWFYWLVSLHWLGRGGALFWPPGVKLGASQPPQEKSPPKKTKDKKQNKTESEFFFLRINKKKQNSTATKGPEECLTFIG